MATFDDLEHEVLQLRQRIRGLEGGNARAENAAAVAELVGQNPDHGTLVRGDGTSGGFARACERSAAQALERLDAEAVREARRAPIRTIGSQNAFVRRFNKLGDSRCIEILREHGHLRR